MNEGYWAANLSIGEMYRHGEGVAVNMDKAIHHFEIFAKHENDEGHWNLACIFESEKGNLDENRAFYHYRLAADLGHLEAREVVGEHFVRVSSPRKLSFTNDELQILLREFESKLERSNNCTRTILSLEGLPTRP